MPIYWIPHQYRQILRNTDEKTTYRQQKKKRQKQTNTQKHIPIPTSAQKRRWKGQNTETRGNTERYTESRLKQTYRHKKRQKQSDTQKHKPKQTNTQKHIPTPTNTQKRSPKQSKRQKHRTKGQNTETRANTERYTGTPDQKPGRLPEKPGGTKNQLILGRKKPGRKTRTRIRPEPKREPEFAMATTGRKTKPFAPENQDGNNPDQDYREEKTKKPKSRSGFSRITPKTQQTRTKLLGRNAH